MKKLLSLALVALLSVSLLAACNTEKAAKGYELALVTDVGTIDDKSFNQGAWEGLKAYAEANNITYTYYKPQEKSTDSYVEAIELAIEGGAKTIVTPGFLFENAVWVAQQEYPDVNFILLDGSPHNVTDWETMATYDDGEENYDILDNTLSIFYAEQESGFLAGYAAVKEGYTKLGFMGGMAVPAVVKFGYGFVEGANYAAEEMGVDITIDYMYTGVFWATDEVQNTAAAWYTSGTEVIFVAAGGAGSSVMKAAEQNDGKVIGVDVDQSGQSETVITSAMKGLGASVEQAITDLYAGNFEGGKSIVKDATVNGVGLPSDFSRFSTFTKEDYDTIYAVLAADEYDFKADTSKDIETLYGEYTKTTITSH